MLQTFATPSQWTSSHCNLMHHMKAFIVTCLHWWLFSMSSRSWEVCSFFKSAKAGNIYRDNLELNFHRPNCSLPAQPLPTVIASNPIFKHADLSFFNFRNYSTITRNWKEGTDLYNAFTVCHSCSVHLTVFNGICTPSTPQASILDHLSTLLTSQSSSISVTG